MSVEHNEQPNLLALPYEFLRHDECYDSSGAVASKQIGTFWLDSPEVSQKFERSLLRTGVAF